ncbi:MAG: glycosyltransferase family 2 protein [Candidatus Omnitrophota bacterium]
MMTAVEGYKKISFIIPTYNAGEHLERCLKSIICQGYQQEKLEILIIDGGSGDKTLEIAENFGCKILNNPRRLAEYGVQIGVKEAEGELLVIFAADNELVGEDWLKKVEDVFNSDPGVSAAWGRLVAGKKDASLNKYFELIQSDPLNWFLNNNLNMYRHKAKGCGEDYFIFNVDPAKPLVWGANGLAYRSERIKEIWMQEGYLGDNDAFQYMIEKGNNKVAYFNGAFVYHHHVARISDWVGKWRRNFNLHLLSQQETRNMNWVFTGNFNIKLFSWSMYSALPFAALIHSLYLCLKSKNLYWFYHPMISCAQFWTYAILVLTTAKGRNFVKNLFS